MTTTINISYLQIFLDKALDVDELLARITQRLQAIDLPSPAATSSPAVAAQDQTEPIAPSEAPVTIARLDANNNLELVQESRPPQSASTIDKEPLFSVRFPPGNPTHRNGLGNRKPETEPQPVSTAPGSRKPQNKSPGGSGSRLATDLATKRAANGAAMDFEQFDALVCREVRRLSSAGIMPSHSLWNEMRDPTLPVLASVMRRYGAASAEELAAILGYSPPLRGPAKNIQVAEAQTETQSA